MDTLTLARKQQLALRFGARGNNGKIKYSKRVIAVESLEDASRKWEEIRDSGGLGASNSPLVVVVDVDSGEHVAKISYNGRIWAADGTEIALAGRKTAAVGIFTPMNLPIQPWQMVNSYMVERFIPCAS